ncbi:hypothetical protein BOX15_Mlig001939g4 [Macrostomum lignano]|uniref:Uncharacterized protein n=1 Tax=Macrostomum lignano TaxID=282301 RepID=A0A267DM64_9PLAT|nr:hypothetical protein BOX15_Mlig001939g4 [Macrostomum lignano]
MLAQTKRDSTAKEVEQLGEELNQKKEQLRRMEESCRARAKELQDFESIGVAKEEIENILAERDELYQLVRQNEDAEFQRYELEKKLNQTREEMQAQAYMSQQKVIALEEELEASLMKIAETSEERNSLKLRLGDLEDRLRTIGATCDELTDANRQLSRAKEVAERERVEEVERLKMRMQGDLSHIQRRTEEEEAAYKRQIQQLKDNLDNLQREVDQREEANCDFRDQLMRLENQLALETETKNHLAQEAERQIDHASAEAERRVEAAREDARRDAEERLERERAAWQAASAKELRECQDRLQRTIGHLESELRCRDEELKAAQELARSKEAALKTARTSTGPSCASRSVRRCAPKKKNGTATIPSAGSGSWDRCAAKPPGPSRACRMKARRGATLSKNSKKSSTSWPLSSNANVKNTEPLSAIESRRSTGSRRWPKRRRPRRCARCASRLKRRPPARSSRRRSGCATPRRLWRNFEPNSRRRRSGRRNRPRRWSGRSERW